VEARGGARLKGTNRWDQMEERVAAVLDAIVPWISLGRVTTAARGPRTPRQREPIAFEPVSCARVAALVCWRPCVRPVFSQLFSALLAGLL
jgi:hypothetical protein